LKLFLKGSKIYIQLTTPSVLVSELCRYVTQHDIKGIEILQSFPKEPLLYLQPEYKKYFRLNTAHGNEACHEVLNDGSADFIPIATSELPLLFRKRHINIDFALVTLTPPDKHGFCSLGAHVGSARSAIQNAKVIVGNFILQQVNPLAPVTYGDSTVHNSRIDFLVYGSQPLGFPAHPAPSLTERKIAQLVVDNLVEDGATIQLGLDRISAAVGSMLTNHKNIGVHSEAITDEIVDLVNLGVIDNTKKRVRPMCDIGWTNLPEVIARNPRVTAVNPGMEIDLTGQVVSGGLGDDITSGRPIITLSSLKPDGNSAIVPLLTPGGGVVCTRAHVHYVVTEYGIAFLFGKTLRQRAYELIQIAHPDFR
uniref:Acetyl-CoA hydrolase n=1 Tax=Schistocephalus solidus TaxID=70667 RepID=A0A183T554_SCHSO